MNGEYHNIPTINGVPQDKGRIYASKNAEYDEDSGKLSIDLTGVYPPAAQLEYFRRDAVIEDGKAIVTDEIVSKTDGEIIFNLLTVSEPKFIEAGKMVVCGKSVEFDPSLHFFFDNPDCTWEETQVLPKHWGIEKFYRIRLCAKMTANEKYTFRLAVNK